MGRQRVHLPSTETASFKSMGADGVGTVLAIKD